MIVERFVEVCRRRGMKVNAGKSRVILLYGEEELECAVYLIEILLEEVSEFEYLGFVLDESGTNGAECSRKVVNGRRVAGAIRTLVNARDLQLEFAKILHETLLVPVLMYIMERKGDI